MSDVKWTAAQRRAIDEGGNILVSAAAGSGKTATLSAKIMHLLSENDASLDQFLIVTFTNAAASELKERIGREITRAAKADRSMMRHKRDVAGADICTIHSFCMKLIRRYFTTLGISPDFSIADETSAKVMKARAMETTVDDFFRGDERITSKGACDIFTLADTVGKTKDAAGLDTELRALAGKLDSLGLDEGYIAECADGLMSLASEDFFASPYGDVIRSEVISAVGHYRTVIDDVSRRMAESSEVAEKYMPAAEALMGTLDRVLRAGESYEKMYEAIRSPEKVSLGRLSAKHRTEASEEFKAVREKTQKVITDLANKYFSCTVDEVADSMIRTAAVLKGASDVLKVYRERYSALKRERGVLDFSDLETLALRLLENGDGTPSAEAIEAGSRYRYVFIDEYQDTNSVQDRIFRAVSSNADKFFVGDIKQSIYRFRGAEPEVFSGYRRAWPENAEDVSEASGYPKGHSIFMSENFRCAKPVIDFVNAVSRYMFPHGGIPFTESDCLVYGGVAAGDVPVELCLIDGTKAKDEGDLPAISEAEYAADRVYQLISREGYVPGDIAVILRSANTSGATYESALKARGIPVKRSGGSSFSDEAEVILVLDILRAVDNPMRDIPLAGAMMSSVFGFTMDDLVLIRREADCPLYTSVERCAERDTPLGEKCRAFCETLESLRRAERGMSADRFIEHLYAECGLMQCAEVTSKLFGEANLHMLHELARSYESGVFGGLYGFLAFVDEKLEANDLTSEGLSDGDGVTIISVHKSKGLEYKVCLLCECGKGRNEIDERARVLFDKSIGIGLRLPDPGGLILCGNPIRDAVAEKMSLESAMEEMRVLYVALTRAKERLIVTAKCHGTPDEELAAAAKRIRFTDSYSVISSKRMLDHILGGVLMSGDSVCTVTRVLRGHSFSETSRIEVDEACSGDSVSPVEIDEIRSRIAFEYSKDYLRDIPSKLAVSALYPAVLDDVDDVPAVLESVEQDDGTSGTEQEMPRPRFMTGGVDTTPAERGTSTHVFLQFASLSALRESGVRAELDRLTEHGFITPRMASLVNRAQVEHFAASGIVERILTAPRVYREFRFNVLLPASRFTENAVLRETLDETGETITVQGVFDCVFENAGGRLVLLDYKTDAMTLEERREPLLGRRKLLERHTRQLAYYAEAVKQLFGRYPDDIYIYSLALGEAVEVML